MRVKLKARKDRNIFRRSAIKSKKINVNPSQYRGGIRL